MERAECLDSAKEIVTGDRNVQYGEPKDNFSLVADLWSVYLCDTLTAADVANLMILFKVARNRGGHKDDNWVDICGYAACGAEVQG